MLIRLFALLALFSLAGCANDSAQPIQIAPLATPGAYQSFSVEPIRASGHRIDLEQRFTTAVIRALNNKGYQQADTADMQVIYALGLERQAGMDIKPVQVGGATYNQTLATEQEQARLVLRIIDSRSKAVIYQANIARTLNNPDLSQERFDQGVDRLFKDFPDRHPAQ